MSFQQRRYLLDAPQYSGLIFAEREVGLHLPADGLPLGGLHPGMHPAVGNNLHIAIGEQQIDEYPVVMSRIPDSQFGKDVDSTFSRRHSVQ